MAHETVQAWLWDVWSRLRLALEADAARPGGHTMALIESSLANLGAFLADDAGARARLQARGRGRSSRRCCRARRPSSPTSSATWWRAGTPTTITDKLELRVGRDLQFVRVNGTLVGFLAGGALFLLLRAAGRAGVAP